MRYLKNQVFFTGFFSQLPTELGYSLRMGQDPKKQASVKPTVEADAVFFPNTGTHAAQTASRGVRIAHLHKRQESVPERISNLLNEASECRDPRKAAILYYEVGTLFEEELEQEGKAIDAFLNAFNQFPQFRPPLFALIRIFERRKSTTNLERLYETEAKMANTDSERLSAYLDLAWLKLHRGKSQQGEALFLEIEKFREAPLAYWILKEHLTGQHASSGASVAHGSLLRSRIEQEPDVNMSALLEMEWADQFADSPQEKIKSYKRAAERSPHLAPLVWSKLIPVCAFHHQYEDLVWALLGIAKHSTSLFREPSEEKIEKTNDLLRKESAYHHWFAAIIALVYLRQPGQAQALLGAAIELLPRDPTLRKWRILISEIMSDQTAAMSDVQNIFSHHPSDPDLFASLHYRKAEDHHRKGERRLALDALEHVFQTHPDSSLAMDLFYDILRGILDPKEKIVLLIKCAKSQTNAHQSVLYWQASTLLRLSGLPSDALDAEPWENNAPITPLSLLQAAALHADQPLDVYRELAWFAWLDGNTDVAVNAIRFILSCTLDEDERLGWMEMLLAILKSSPKSFKGRAEFESTLVGALEFGGMVSRFAAHALRLHALEEKKPELLEQAYRALLISADPTEHPLYAALGARAILLQQQDQDRFQKARLLLEVHALNDTVHPFVYGLMDEILIKTNDEVMREVLSERAEESRVLLEQETEAMSLGMAHEVERKHKEAILAYANMTSTELSAASSLAMLLLHDRSADPNIRLLSQQHLFEGMQKGQRPELSGLSLFFSQAKHPYQVTTDLEGTSLWRQAYNTDPSHEHAVGLTTTSLLDYLDLLSEAPPSQLASSANSGASLYDLPWVHDEALLLKLCPFTHQPSDVTKALLRRSADDTINGDPLLSHFYRWVKNDSNAFTEDLKTWGNFLETKEAKHAFELLAIRAVWIQGGPEAWSDALLMSDTQTPLSTHQATALLEILSPGEDEQLRAQAWNAKLTEASSFETEPYRRALVRALLAAGELTAAGFWIEQSLREHPEHPFWLWTARCHALEVRQYERAYTCTKALLPISNQHPLFLEDAGALAGLALYTQEAKNYFESALAKDPTLVYAFEQLKSLYAQEGEIEKLLTLCEERSFHTDDANALASLMYDVAILKRALGDLDGALLSLENLSMLDTQHISGLALAIDIASEKEDWHLAVSHLRALVQCDVPPEQKMLSRLTIVEFLEKKLNNPLLAKAELESMATEGMLDQKTAIKLAELTETVGLYSESLAAREKVIGLAHTNMDKAKAESEWAKLQLEAFGNKQAAVEGFKRALSLHPSDLQAARNLISLAPESKTETLKKAEKDLRAQLSDPTQVDLLRKLIWLLEQQNRLWALDPLYQALEILDALSPKESERKQDLCAQLRLLNEGETLDVLPPFSWVLPPSVFEPQLCSIFSIYQASLDALFSLETINIRKEDRLNQQLDPLSLLLRGLAQRLELNMDVYVGGKADDDVKLYRAHSLVICVVGRGRTALPFPQDITQEIAFALMFYRYKLEGLENIGHAHGVFDALVHERWDDPKLKQMNKQDQQRILGCLAQLKQQIHGSDFSSIVDFFESELNKLHRWMFEQSVWMTGNLSAGMARLFPHGFAPFTLSASADAKSLLSSWISEEAEHMRQSRRWTP